MCVAANVCQVVRRYYFSKSVGRSMSNESLRDLWLMFQREHQCSLDRMLCNPQLRGEFLQAASAVVPDAGEEEILWSLVGLRKRKTLPRTQR